MRADEPRAGRVGDTELERLWKRLQCACETRSVRADEPRAGRVLGVFEVEARASARAQPLAWTSPVAWTFIARVMKGAELERLWECLPSL